MDEIEMVWWIPIMGVWMKIAILTEKMIIIQWILW